MRRALCLVALVACAKAPAPRAPTAAPVTVETPPVEPVAAPPGLAPPPTPVAADPPPPDPPPPPPAPEPTKAALGVALQPGRYLVDGVVFDYRVQNVCGMRTDGCVCTIVHQVETKGASITVIGDGQSSVAAGHRFTVKKDAIVVRRK